MTLDVKALRQIMPLLSPVRAIEFLQPLNDAMEIHEISTLERQAAFLAQIAHESGELAYMQEIASGAAYEGRKDLGNVEPGDGVKFKGRGPIQITGRANYRLCSLDLYDDERLLDTPSLLEQPFDGCMGSAWFWKHHGLNELADARDFVEITRRINGGMNGFTARETYYKRALEVLGGLA
jgi:putative chitinase